MTNWTIWLGISYRIFILASKDGPEIIAHNIQAHKKPIGWFCFDIGLEDTLGSRSRES